MSSFGGIFEKKRFSLTKRDLPNRSAFEKGDGNWLDILPTITKRYNIRLHSSIKITPIHASSKKNE